LISGGKCRKGYGNLTVRLWVFVMSSFGFSASHLKCISIFPLGPTRANEPEALAVEGENSPVIDRSAPRLTPPDNIRFGWQIRWWRDDYPIRNPSF